MIFVKFYWRDTVWRKYPGFRKPAVSSAHSSSKRGYSRTAHRQNEFVCDFFLKIKKKNFVKPLVWLLVDLTLGCSVWLFWNINKYIYGVYPAFTVICLTVFIECRREHFAEEDDHITSRKKCTYLNVADSELARSTSGQPLPNHVGFRKQGSQQEMLPL